jgi:hypothetical protein
MSIKYKKIVEYFNSMSIPIDEQVLSEYSADEKDKLEKLAERMFFIWDKVNTDTSIPAKKLSFLKKEFDALQWVFYQFNIISDNTH